MFVFFYPLFDTLQVAIAQFSDDARTEFQLSSHSNKEALLEAIQKISYKGGNTKTGADHVLIPHLNLLVVRWVWIILKTADEENCSALRTLILNFISTFFTFLDKYVL